MTVPSTPSALAALARLRPEELALALDDAARFRDGRATAIYLDCAGQDDPCPCQAHQEDCALADRFRAAALALEDADPTDLPAGPGLVLSGLTLGAVQAEATRAHVRHGIRSMMGPAWTPTERLAILAEELGEVAHELTYDQQDAGQPARLVRELIQVAAMAASWVEVLEGS
jgi:hypothetical protein